MVIICHKWEYQCIWRNEWCWGLQKYPDIYFDLYLSTPLMSNHCKNQGAATLLWTSSHSWHRTHPMRLQRSGPKKPSKLQCTCLNMTGPLKQEVYEEEHQVGCGQALKCLTHHSEMLKFTFTQSRLTLQRVCKHTAARRACPCMLYCSAITRPLLLQTV